MELTHRYSRGWGFTIYVFLKMFASRTYAAALLSNLKARRIVPGDLQPVERTALGELDLLLVPDQPERHVIIRTVAGGGRFAKSMTIGFATAIVWFAFVSQTFDSEFLNYHPVDGPRGNFLGGWLNQPLVQLPWFNYTPGDLRERARTGTPAEMNADRDAVI